MGEIGTDCPKNNGWMANIPYSIPFLYAFSSFAQVNPRNRVDVAVVGVFGCRLGQLHPQHLLLVLCIEKRGKSNDHEGPPIRV
jgi:hypothetical protein